MTDNGNPPHIHRLLDRHRRKGAQAMQGPGARQAGSLAQRKKKVTLRVPPWEEAEEEKSGEDE